MGLSNDPEKRARSLANLKNGQEAAKIRNRSKGLGNKSPRKDFEPGNKIAVTHGARSQLPCEALEAKVQQVLETLSAAAPVRAADGSLPTADAVVVRLLADVLCRLDLVGTWLSENGLFDGADVRPAVDLERRLRKQAAEFAAELGMTPRARAALGLDLARAQSAAERLDDHLRANYDVEGEAS